jgi:hypothetical protein
MKTSPLLHVVTDILWHEVDTLDGHLAGLHERIQVARHARSLPEGVRQQLDLLPATAQRLAQDHQARLRLLKGLSQVLG